MKNNEKVIIDNMYEWDNQNNGKTYFFIEKPINSKDYEKYLTYAICECGSINFTGSANNAHWALVYPTNNKPTLEEMKSLCFGKEIVYELKDEVKQVIDLGTLDDMNMTYNPITNISTSIDNIKAKVKYYRDFIYTIRNMEIDNNTLQAQLQDLEERVSALETAPTIQSMQLESEVVENA